jgi:hypothetical protein
MSIEFSQMYWGNEKFSLSHTFVLMNKHIWEIICLIKPDIFRIVMKIKELFILLMMCSLFVGSIKRMNNSFPTPEGIAHFSFEYPSSLLSVFTIS